VVLRLRDYESNHNGGQLAFGPDDMLYLAMGDGGGGGDSGEGHAEGGNGQSLRTLKGKILRIDPEPDGDSPYTIPSDNPFASGGGRPEIWSYGLRNPWRFSFDAQTGDLWIGDVGQNAFEEIDVAPARDGGGRGVNFGWNLFEARERYRDRREGERVGDLREPVLALAADDGNCSVIAGYVYRGSEIPDLVGAFVYADYCNGEIRWLRQRDNEVTAKERLGVSGDSIASFGQDNDGELYVLSQSDGLFKLVPED
jgi:glucose/arabinose dehydrogenase